MSLPRELKLFGSQVQMRPAAEVETLRGKKLGGDAEGDSIEIRAEVDPGASPRAGLSLRMPRRTAANRRWSITIASKRTICVDRSQSSTDPSADRKMQSGPFQCWDAARRFGCIFSSTDR
jgi:sucrose-6-phosphate hydrolase SacC (GH32 family)